MYVEVSGSKWVKVYFITWYFIAVILGLNLLISFILEIYVTTITQFEVIDLKEMEQQASKYSFTNRDGDQQNPQK